MSDKDLSEIKEMADELARRTKQSNKKLTLKELQQLAAKLREYEKEREDEQPSTDSGTTEEDR